MFTIIQGGFRFEESIRFSSDTNDNVGYRMLKKGSY